MNEARLFGSAALLIVLIAVAYMSTTREGGEGGDVSKGGGACPLNRPVGPSADVPPPPSKRDRPKDFYDDLDDSKVKKILNFDEPPITVESEDGKIRLTDDYQRRLDALRGLHQGADPKEPEKKPKETNLYTDLDLDDVRSRLFNDGKRLDFGVIDGETPARAAALAALQKQARSRLTTIADEQERQSLLGLLSKPIGGPKPPHEALHSQSDVCRTDGDLRGQIMTSKMAACKPRSIASIKRMRTKEDANRGVPENETEWGVCAFDDAIMDPLYPEYLKYLERINKGGERIENEARNQMHDVLTELLNRPKLSDAKGNRIENEARNRMHDVLVELNKKSGNWVTDRTKERNKSLGQLQEAFDIRRATEQQRTLERQVKLNSGGRGL